jgi:beta-phosphoglucomutase family hydrolase
MVREMSSSKVKAVIWDMDGVIADTAPYHLTAWRGTFQKRGVEFTEEDFKHSFGLRNDTIIRNILGEEVSPNKIEVISREKEADFRRRIGQDLRPLPGVISLLTSLKEHEVKVALASSAPIENIRLLITGLGIDSCFQAIVSGKDVTEGKPSPQAFLLAAQKVGVEPPNCIVIEDAIAGIAAAKGAGMRCLAVTGTHPRESLAGADLIVDSLEEVTVNDLEMLLNPRQI